MGLEEEEEDEKRELLQPSFLEVACRSSGKLRRFAAGTEAGFALNLINRKLGAGTQPSLYIEAVKEGEEPVSFGPNSVLVNYGEGWKLQTVLAEDYEEGKRVQSNTKQFPPSTKSFDNHPDGKDASGSRPSINFMYFGKILLAFVFIFLLGGTFTLILENLPRLILFITSSF
ncbi:hypothetical protein CKAN_01427400 [Cinnamomum micranthum f. kanehirae]|uniref:Uncharacterized protein n=1 Tax=Cinnamomum micranthum f. kanehirae TaxID=337451 RepID=A0A443P3P2_9MAGN|nr:hypothetical protein CKAN_01427400 [Cinnamomum micranthum f. kanehirae]